MANYNRIVVKIGTSTITSGTNKINMPRLIFLVQQISQIMESGVNVALVTSGAVAAGREVMNYPQLAKHIPKKQVLSAIGQPRLMSIFNNLFQMYGHVSAQVLLTSSDFQKRVRYLNARNTLEGLFDQKVIPVINENDTVYTEEFHIGENDTLSAYVSGLIGADLLVLITDQDGVYDQDPEMNPEAKLIEKIEEPEIPEWVWNAAGKSSTGLGTGGMITKISAADIARRMGTKVMIVNGSTPDILTRIVSGEAFGTTFLPANTILESRKRYLVSGLLPKSTAIHVDEGASAAILSGKSLLPVGITGITGNFERGDTVRVLDPQEKETAIGMVQYSSSEVEKIIGKKAGDIETILGYSMGDEVIHHDTMIIH